MSGTAIAVSILTLVAGVGVFLIACGMMSSNLESLGSKRLKSLFAKTTGKKLVGVGVGAAATAAIQSSSATTVMVIGFVNAGIMTLTQAATVIFGANIGTTITGQLVALGMFGNSAISSSVVFAALAGIGAFMLAFAKRDRVRKVGGILAGFGMIFVGLSLMSGAMESFASNDGVRDFLATFKNPFLLVLIGALLTAVVQSSSVMTSMAITMTVTGLISLNQGVYITMGSNIGTCVTALIAGIASGRNAKRAALIHFIFNVSGVIIFLLVGMFMRLGGTDYGHVFQKIFPGVPQTQLAMFHTVFNVATVILILPLTNLLVKLVTKIIPDKKTEIDKDAPRLRYLDEHMLATPPIAVQQTKNEVVAMAQTAFDNFVLSCEIASTLDFARVEEFRANEKALNYLNRNIAAFTVKLLKCELDERDRTYLTTVFKAVTDLERIGDYAENIVEYAEKLRDGGERFSEDAVTEIAALRVLVQSLYDSALKAYVGADKQALANAYVTEESIDDMTDKLSENHIARLSSGACTPDVGALFLMLTSNVERIADHLINVAKAAQYGGK